MQEIFPTFPGVLQSSKIQALHRVVTFVFLICGNYVNTVYRNLCVCWKLEAYPVQKHLLHLEDEANFHLGSFSYSRRNMKLHKYPRFSDVIYRLEEITLGSRFFFPSLPKDCKEIFAYWKSHLHAAHFTAILSSNENETKTFSRNKVTKLRITEQ